MVNHLDHNGPWVLLVYAIVLCALMLSVIFTAARTRKRQKDLNRSKKSDA